MATDDTMSRRRFTRCFRIILIFIFVSLIIVFVMTAYLQDHTLSEVIPVASAVSQDVSAFTHMDETEIREAKSEFISAPILLWWTGFTKEAGDYRTCGKDRCFFTARRKYWKHPNTRVFLFYGTDTDPTDLPLPRLPHHEWALFHEESPKNNVLFSFEDMLALFNYTSTFRRTSDYPITTQYVESLEWLMSTDHMKSLQTKNQLQKEKGLAPIVYVHSDCDPPSDRDSYVKLLMEHIAVDSYGSCLNNKQLPQNLADPVEGMFHAAFYELLSQYKFALAMENAVCEDYITEKLWRPLKLGVVPIVYGSPSVKDMLPTDQSAIVITDFKDVESLANFVRKLNSNDSEYAKYVSWKQTGIKGSLLYNHLTQRDWTDGDMVSSYECFVCNKVHENLHRQKQGLPPLRHIANISHYGCPVPRGFDKKGNIGQETNWKYEWKLAGKVANTLRWRIENNGSFTAADMRKHAVIIEDDLR